MFITTHHLTHCYPGSESSALRDVSITLACGWTGVVGSNGAGKSTLLKILCGELPYYQGSVSPKIAGTYCAQGTEIASSVLEDFAFDYRPEAVKLRYLLGIDDAWLWRFETLSYGEKKRIQIACALVNNPVLLALDEPTNHLDTPTRALVTRTLSRYRGVGLLVSHDRMILDELVSSCIFLDAGCATVISGSYTQAKAELDLRRKTAVDQRRNARLEVSRLQAESERRANEAARSASRRSARHLDRHDTDGRAKIKLAVYTGQDGKAGKLSTQVSKRVEQAQQQLADISVKKCYEGALRLETTPSKRKVLVTIPKNTIELGEGRYLEHPTLHVGNIDHIGLTGQNGAGKSTLLRILLERVNLDEGIVYIPQELTAAQGKSILSEIKQLPPNQRGNLLSIVARLGSPPTRLLEGEEMSPGEMRKLLLAKGLIAAPKLIVMDEPTNHLDIHSIEALQAVLTDCACALVLVSHDLQFLDALTATRWVFEVDNTIDGSQGNTHVRAVL